MAFARFGISVTEKKILSSLHVNPDLGTDNWELARWAKERFCTSVHQPGSLELIAATIEAGAVVIANFVVPKNRDSMSRSITFTDGEESEGHFGVVTGITADGLRIHDPYFGPHCKISFEDFLAQWRPHWSEGERFMLVLWEVREQVRAQLASQGLLESPDPT